MATALIIAGGEGERLRPLTTDRPKPMVLLAGRPILEHQVAWLARNGVGDVVFLCGYRADVVRAHFGDGQRFGVRVRYAVEDAPLGRGGALKHGFGLVGPAEDPIVALNGDVLTDQPLAPLLRQHARTGAVATVLVTRLRSPYGIATIGRSGRIAGFAEKPLLPHWLNAGVYVLARAFFDRLPDRGDHETVTFPALASEGRLFAYRSRAYWRPIDTAKDLAEAGREIGQFRGGE